jgi:hypothetical protein
LQPDIKKFGYFLDPSGDYLIGVLFVELEIALPPLGWQDHFYLSDAHLHIEDDISVVSCFGMVELIVQIVFQLF